MSDWAAQEAALERDASLRKAEARLKSDKEAALQALAEAHAQELREAHPRQDPGVSKRHAEARAASLARKKQRVTEGAE